MKEFQLYNSYLGRANKVKLKHLYLYQLSITFVLYLRNKESFLKFENKARLKVELELT